MVFFKLFSNQEQKSVKEEPVSENSVPAKGTTASLKTGSTPTGGPAGPVSEEEIRAVLMQKSPITTRDLVNNFPGRLKSKEVWSIWLIGYHALYCCSTHFPAFASPCNPH